MNMRSICVSLITMGVAFAQFAPPNNAGVTMGHLHLTVKDMEAHRQFWTTLGGTPVKNGRIELIEFPGVYVMLRQAAPAGGTQGSVVDHVGFRVKNLKESLAKWQSAGLKVQSATAAEAYVMAPDDVQIEITEDPALRVPIASQSITLVTPSVTETEQWYAKTFGARAGKRNAIEIGQIPGAELRFSAANTALAGTKGRSLDHIGFEVKNLEEFCKKLEAAGIKLDQPYRKLPNTTLAIAFLTDPWGTYIELTEGLAPVSQ